MTEKISTPVPINHVIPQCQCSTGALGFVEQKAEIVPEFVASLPDKETFSFVSHESYS